MKKPLLITYIALGAFTLSTFLPLTIWASLGSSGAYSETEIVKAGLSLTNEVRLEYIEYEEFDPTGITFIYNKKEVDVDDVTINYDFSVSGTRVVEFIKEVGNKHYRALLPVTVYHVRHLDVRDQSLNWDYENETWDYSKLTVWAELNQPAKSLPIPEGFNENQKVRVLNSNQYGLSVNPTSISGVYQANVSVGNAGASFNYYDSRTFNSERILVMTNQSGNADRLTLFAETSSNNFTSINYEEEVRVRGKYLYENGEGVKKIYEFSYIKAANSWDSIFNSNTLNGEVNDYFDNETSGFKCVINGTTFYASPDEWHKPILGTPEEGDDPIDPGDDPAPVDTNATIIVGSNAQLEYFVGETLNLNDLSFQYEETVIDASEIDDIAYNFSTSGTKLVVFTKTVGETEYVASIEVKVLRIKSFDVRNNNIFKNSDNSWDYSTLSVWVDLDGQSSRLEKPADFPEPEQTAFILTPEYFDVTVTESLKAGVYECKLMVGSASTTFNYFEESAFDSQRILHLHNRSGNGDKLTLFVLNSSSNYVWGEMEIIVTGEYLYEKSNGDKYTYNFYYYKAQNSWTSEFKSAEHNGYRLNDYYGCIEDAEGFTAEVNGVAFYSLPSEWHMPILNF